MLAKLDEGFDVVFGVPKKLPHSWWRNLTSVITKEVVGYVMGYRSIRDISSYRVFRTRIRSAFADYRGPDLLLDVLLTWGTNRFGTVPVDENPRTVGESNYNLSKLIKLALTLKTGPNRRTDPERLPRPGQHGFARFVAEPVVQGLDVGGREHAREFQVSSVRGGRSRDWFAGPEDPRAPISEALAGEPLGGKTRQKRTQFRNNVLGLHIVVMEPVQARSALVATEVNLVATGSLAHQANLRHVGAGAPIRAARHADDDLLVGQAHLRQHRFKLGDQVRQVALAFGQSQSAGGQRHTGHRSPAQEAALILQVHPVLGQEPGDLGLLARSNVPEDDIVPRRQPHLRL